MALSTAQQILEAVKKSANILIVFRKKFEIDSVVSACALAEFLKKFGKIVELACDGFASPENLMFLPAVKNIHSRLGEMSKLAIAIDLKDTELDQLSYDVKDNKLSVYITPKRGALDQESVKVENSGFVYDLICCLDTPDLESLGAIYDDQVEMFQTKPVINIDYHPANDNYGQIRYHDVTVSCAAELVFHLMMELQNEYINDSIAQYLLAGLIAKTKSFSTQNVTSRTLQTAKALIEHGADRNTIIKNLFRNKTLAVVNLWGRVLARLRHDKDSKLAWSLIPEYDFIDTSTTEKNLDGVVEEFVRDIPGIEVFLLFYQKGQSSHIHIYSLMTHDAMHLAKNHKATGTRQFASLALANTPLVEAEKKITEEIKGILRAEKRI